jgi:hypothetical protein
MQTDIKQTKDILSANRALTSPDEDSQMNLSDAYSSDSEGEDQSKDSKQTDSKMPPKNPDSIKISKQEKR